jgi:hypothetical protein
MIVDKTNVIANNSFLFNKDDSVLKINFIIGI